jgi:hypothetical protein
VQRMFEYSESDDSIRSQRNGNLSKYGWAVGRDSDRRRQ